MQIIERDISELIPYINNAKKHPTTQVDQIAASIKEFGFNNPILLDGENGIIAGHGRVDAAKKLKIKTVPTIELSHLSDIQKKAYILADNRLSESGGTGWDFELVSLELDALLDQGFDIDLTGFDKSFLDDQSTSDIYTKKVETPIYEPKNEKPTIYDLFDNEKTEELKQNIIESDLPEDEKEFLIAASSRHTVFNYEKIADYYANSDKETQELMEQSALVIIDFDKAIEQGYIQLSEEVAAQYGKEYDQ